MSIPVQLQGLADKIADRRMAPYLLTTGDDGRPHATAIALGWDDGVLVGPCGRSSGRNLTERPTISILWPPDEVGGYSLIVDADAVLQEQGDTRLARLTPTHAILHRPADVPDPATDCEHDCQKVL